MMARSRWRRAGRLAHHLKRVDTNRHVRERPDLCRHAPADTHQAVQLFTAISRSNPRVTRDLIHVRCSPQHALTDHEILRLIERFEHEHAIPETMPRHVIEHGKGARPDHVHVTYPVVDPVSGRAVRSNNNYFNDELVSRLAEIEFGEPIVPGPRQNEVVAELRRRGLEREAELLAGHGPVAAGRRIGDAAHQQAASNGVNVGLIMTAVFEAWQNSAADWKKFERAIEQDGYAIARGDRAILLVDQRSGTHMPLARMLRQTAKAAGVTMELRERDLRARFEDAAPFSIVRERGLDKEGETAAIAVDDEVRRMADEAAADGQTALSERLRLVRVRMQAERKARLKRTLAARRAAIRADYARRDRIRRARVHRAFAVAKMLDRRDLRRAAFALAGTGVLLAGGGLGLALVVAGVAVVAALPTRERARAGAFEAGLQRAADLDATAIAVKKAYEAVAAEAAPRVVPFRFESIDKHLRGVAGLYAHTVLATAEGVPSDTQVLIKGAAARVLGEQAEAIEVAVLHASGRAALALLRWYHPDNKRQQQAAAASLRRHGEESAATLIVPPSRVIRRIDRGGHER